MNADQLKKSCPTCGQEMHQSVIAEESEAVRLNALGEPIPPFQDSLLYRIFIRRGPLPVYETPAAERA